MQLICNDMGRTRRLTSPSSLALAGGAVDFSSLSLSSVSHKRGVYKHADSVGWAESPVLWLIWNSQTVGMNKYPKFLS